MEVLLFALLWIVMTILTASILFVFESRGRDGQRFGGTEWADRFIAFYVLAGVFWPIVLPVILMGLAVRSIGRLLAKVAK